MFSDVKSLLTEQSHALLSEMSFLDSYSTLKGIFKKTSLHYAFTLFPKYIFGLFLGEINHSA
jgi:hypothetical protein